MKIIVVSPDLLKWREGHKKISGYWRRRIEENTKQRMSTTLESMQSAVHNESWKIEK